MAGTILLTGANGSLAVSGVNHLLANYPDLTAVLTVRNVSGSDTNTKKLREIISQHKDAKVSIRQLDLADLSAVHDFAVTLAAEIADKKLPPLVGIIANAYYWNLASEADVTSEGIERTFQVNFVANVALVLRLLGSFSPNGGRITLISSDSHWSGKNPMEQYPPEIPDDLDALCKPLNDGNDFGRGFQRYANSKLALTTWGYALSRHLEKNPTFKNVTVASINPGNLFDSRALVTNTPQFLADMSKGLQASGPPAELLEKDPTMRKSEEAGADVVDLATNKAAPGKSGYFTLLKEDVSSPQSQDVSVQDKLWAKSIEWARITKETTALGSAGIP